MGGVAGNQIYASTSGLDWTPVQLPLAARSWTVGEPVALSQGRVAIPVTVHNAGSSSTADIFVTRDSGVSWAKVAELAVDAGTEANTTVPAAVASDEHWFVFAPDGSRVYRGDVSDASVHATVSPNGPPSGVTDVAVMSASTGFALATTSNCPDGKASCTELTSVLRTTDGGQTWQPVGT